MNTNKIGIFTLGLALILSALHASGDGRQVPEIKTPKKSRPQPDRRPQTQTPTVISFVGGALRMGSDTGPMASKPAHTVNVSPFKLDVFEASVKDYKSCVDAGKCSEPKAGEGCTWNVAGKEDHAINCIDSYQAEKYCSFRSKRLPTEQEWEFAARGTEGRRYAWGETEPVDQLCWKRKEGTCTVGTPLADRTPAGVFGLAGNVAEWTSSPFCPYGSTSCVSQKKAVRGGFWSKAAPDQVQGVFREGFDRSIQNSRIGVRCAETVPEANR